MLRSLGYSILALTLLFSALPPGAAAESTSEPVEIWARAVAQADVADAETDDDAPIEGADEKATARESAGAFSEMIENIVVTSRKRRESIQNIPLSVTALSDMSLKQLGVRRIQDVAASVPSLEYSPTIGSANSARANIRGVGQSDPIGTQDPGVGLYVDGVYLPRLQSGLLSTIDVERIEVVRGPQGTIFGKNTIGGAVSVVTRLPQFELGSALEVRVGNFDLFETRAMLNVPLVEETAAMRLSVATTTRDGFSKERLGGSDPNDDKLLAGRLQLLFLPSEDMEIRLSGDYSRENKVQDTGKCLVQNPGANFQIQLANSLVGYTAACADVQASNNPRRVETDLSFLRDELESYGASAQILWELGPDTELRSLTSVRGLDNEGLNDFDGTRIELIRPAIDAGGFEQTQISQELQLSTTMMDEKVNLLVGLFGFKEQSKDTVFEGVLSNLAPEDIVDVSTVLGPIAPALKPILADMAKGAQIKSLNRVDNLNYAAYTQVSYAVSERLDFTAGVRLTHERRRLFREGTALTDGLGIAIPADGSTGGIPARLMKGATAFFFERSDRFTDITPSASLSYRFSPNVLGYLNYSTGFKSGGFNGRAFPPLGSSEADFPISVDPEDLTTYEAGFKATFADQRVALNAAAFYSIYEDIQLVVLPGDPTINNVPVQLLNAGEAIISGGELELTVSPIPNLQIRTALGVLHDRYTEFDDPSDPRASDRRLPFLSAYESSTSVQYSFDLARLGSLIARADWTTRSRQFLDPMNTGSLEAGKRGLLDARLSLELFDGETEIALFGQNLLDREYLVSGGDFSNTFGSTIRFVGPPRTYGLELRRRF